MKCIHCNEEISDDSLFCSQCGSEVNRNNGIHIVHDKKKMPNQFTTKKTLILIIITLCIFSLGFALFKQKKLSEKADCFRSLIRQENFKEATSYYASNKNVKGFIKKADKAAAEEYEEAAASENTNYEISIFNSNLLNEEYVLKLEETLTEKIKKFHTQFINEEKTFKEISAPLNTYTKYKNDKISKTAKEALSGITSLKSSRDAYAKGVKSADSKDYKAAMESLSKVISEDANYSDAQHKMKEIVPLYKKETLESADSDISKNNYAVAIVKLENLAKFCSDSDVTSKLTQVKEQKKIYDTEQKKIQIQKLKNEQQVEVASSKTWNSGYYITFMKGGIVVKNNSSKVAKEVTLSVLQFDNNGYPVDVQYSIYQGKYSNELNCSFSSCNIEPGKTYGENWEFNVPEQCRKIKACVREVIYTDNSTWINPYYRYWLEDNYAAY